MAGGVNKVILREGRQSLARIRTCGTRRADRASAELRVATSESWNDKNGQRQERVEWHRIVVWGKRAEVCSKYLSKGRQVYVEGRIQTRTYDDKDGNKRYITEVIANDVQFLGGGNREGGGAAGARGGAAADGPPPPSDGDFGGGGYGGGAGGAGGGGGGPDDDIPF